MGISDCTVSSNHHHCILFPFRCHFIELKFTARLEFRKYNYSRPLTSIDYLNQIHIPFHAVSGSHFYGKPIYCLFKKADTCNAILDTLFNKYDIFINLLDIYYKEDILLARLHEVHRAIVVTSVVPVYVYVYVRVTLSVKVFL